MRFCRILASLVIPRFCRKVMPKKTMCVGKLYIFTALTVVFGANAVVFGANTVVFGANTVVFGANTVVLCILCIQCILCIFVVVHIVHIVHILHLVHIVHICCCAYFAYLCTLCILCILCILQCCGVVVLQCCSVVVQSALVCLSHRELEMADRQTHRQRISLMFRDPIGSNKTNIRYKYTMCLFHIFRTKHCKTLFDIFLEEEEKY